MNKDLYKREVSEQKTFRRLSNSDLICKDCKFRDKEDRAGLCQRFINGKKPDSVILGGLCEIYKKEE